MATTPQTKGFDVEAEAEVVLPAGHRMAGWTVDALLDQGKIEEARAELEGFISEGINSGPSISMNDEFWDRLLERAQQRALGNR